MIGKKEEMDEKERILIVDDDESTRRSLALIFGKKGYEIETARTGREAIDKARRRFFNVALVDIKLSDIEGVELVTPLRELHPDMVIIMITGHASLENAVRALNKGASAYITKPLNMDEVLAAIRGVLEKQRLVMENKSLLKEIQQELVERKQAEERLRHAAEEWKTTFDSITDLVSIHGKDFRLVRMNKAFADTFGVKPKELIGKTCYQVVHGRNEPWPDCPFRQALEDRRPHTAEFFEPHLGVHLEIAASPIFNEKRELAGIVHITKDITERKRVEAENKELERKAHLASRLATLGTMASGIAHEINNPLTSVIGCADLLELKNIPEGIKENVRIISDGSQRVASIVSRLLTFARQHEPERTSVNINEILQTTLDLRDYELRTNNIKVTTQFDPGLPSTMVDYGQLGQVFLNLIVNAEREMKLAHGRGNLLIKTETLDDTASISVIDDGPGIAKESLDIIFDPFFTTREIGMGTGLGLSICHGIIAEHGGRIYAESELGKGATFIVELPIVPEPEQPGVAGPPVEEAKTVSKAKILVVDDEMAIGRFIVEMLTDEGHTVRAVSNIDDALVRLQSEKYNVILLDIKMPGKSGIELYEHIQKTAPDLANRVVFITADAMGEDTRDFLLKAKARYLTKPFDTKQLKKDINRILSQEVGR